MAAKRGPRLTLGFMFRYLLWRLRFEICNIKRWFGHGPERVKYLAFGANLSDKIMHQRRIKPFAREFFTLRDYGLRFDHPGPHIGCAYASAEYAPGESVYGYLYTLSGRDAARMDFYEAVPVINRYRKTWVEQDGERLFFYQTNIPTPGLAPTPLYLGYIVDGLETHPDVTSEYQQSLAATRTCDPEKMVSWYLWHQPEQRAPWLRSLIGAYQLFALALFINVLYRFSLTALFIRHRP